MKNGSKKFKLLLAVSMAGSVLSSFAVLGLLLLRDDPQTDALVSLVFPLAFWLGLIGEQVLFWLAWRGCRTGAQGGVPDKGRIGLFAPFRTKAGGAADVVFLLCLAGVILLTSLNIQSGVLSLLLISFMILSFRLHCILNGKTMREIKSITARKDEIIA